uniref:START domain-containing protein n=1 Tax=Kalanchoe fedtschenkoi TaxID=63787 RepID=A0A7N0V6W0_KALFE
MDGENKIGQYQERLDNTLACDDLMDESALRELVRNHLLKSSQHESEAEIQIFLENRTKVISSFLDMLRSASNKESGISKTRDTSREWKVKQDNEDFRVMYREGPPGTCYHDLLVEGYIDGPIDVSIGVSTEAPLYKYWWPQYSIPAFKITSSECLHQVRIGEQIASVKVKASWPISSRECLLHYIEFEYFLEDLIIVVLNSISGPDSVEKSVCGIAKEMIPAEENGMVRMGLVGGFALQKVTNDRSYFRTIGSIDLKLDYVPSWIVNFMARQLIGSGFKLYKKAVSSWANGGNEKFQQALHGPLYVRIREALLSDKKVNTVLEPKPSVSDTAELSAEEGDWKSRQQVAVDDVKTMECKPDLSLVEPKTPPVEDLKVTCEIEEELNEESVILLAEETDSCAPQPLADGQTQTNSQSQVSSQEKVHLRSEVTDALLTLDTVIAMVRELGINSQTKPLHGIRNENSLNDENTFKDDGLSSKDNVSVDRSKEIIIRQTSSKSRRSSSVHDSRDARSSSSVKEVSRYAAAPALSPELNMQNPKEMNHSLNQNGTTIIPPDIGEMTTDQTSTRKAVKQRKSGFCCLRFPPGRW